MSLQNMKWYPLVFIGFAVFIIVQNVFFYRSLVERTPSGTTFTYVSGHTGDFYAYNYMIKRGAEGHLLYHDAYNTIQSPAVLNHPFYHMLGLISIPFSVSPFIVFFIARQLTMMLLFFCVYRVIRSAVPDCMTRILATVLFFCSTALYSVTSWKPLTLQSVQVYSDYFNIWSKYFTIPPHHLLALAVFAYILLCLSKPHLSWKTVGIVCVLLVWLGSLHPYILLVLVCVVGVNSFITKEGRWKNICVTGFGGLTILFNSWLFTTVLKFPFAAVSWGDTGITLWHYLSALGPLVFIAPFAVFDRKAMRKPLVRLLFLWAMVPIVLFLLYLMRLPVNIFRIFQVYSQIPLAILSAHIIVTAGTRIRMSKLLCVVVGFAAFVYGGVAYGTAFEKAYRTDQSNFLDIYMPDSLKQLYSAIDTIVPPDGIVFAGTRVSNMMPVFTHARAPLGHASTNTQFTDEQTALYALYGGTMSESEVPAFLKRYAIDAIVFGIDAPAYETIPEAYQKYFTEVYRKGTVSLAKVLY